MFQIYKKHSKDKMRSLHSLLAKSQVVAQFVSNVGGSQQGNGGTLALANDQANRTIQSTLSASVFQIAI